MQSSTPAAMSDESLPPEEARRLLLEMRQSESKHRTLYESMLEAFVIVDMDGRIIETNELFNAMLGYSPEELRQLTYKDITPEKWHACESRIVEEQILKHRYSNVYEKKYRRKDGSVLPVELRTFLLTDDKGRPIGMWAIVRDITARKRTEEELLRAKKEAEAANRAKSQFLADMSHELRTPLNPVIGLSELLAEAPNLTMEQRQWLFVLRQRGMDLLTLIGDILDLAKIEAGKVALERHPLNLREMMKDMMSSIQPLTAKKGLALASHVAPELPDRICADGLRFRQVLLNLLNNAVKFTPTGSIVVRVEVDGTGRLARQPAAGETALLFSVRDTGIGIAEENLSVIFEAFRQADTSQPVEGGTGLGLAIAWNLVALMGGTVWVESVERQGSVFFFTAIVGVIPAAAAGEKARETVGPRQSQPLKILVVDDDPASRVTMEAMIRQRGDDIRSAQDGEEALAMMEAEAFDVVLMDIWMPRMSGIEATQTIRERGQRVGRRTVVIALTAHALAGAREACLAAGMDGYISKPVQKDALFHAIDTALSASRDA